MRHSLRLWPLGVLLLVISDLPLTAQENWARYRKGEILLESDSAYDHPIRHVQVLCTFEHLPTKTRHTHDAFWDGENDYKVRFAPPYDGEWTWTTTSSDTSNKGLHRRKGRFLVEANNDEGDFNQNGWLEPSADGHYLQHESGKPFFWLGCTAWEMTWKSRMPQALEYLTDRRNKRFSAIQIVVFSHQYSFSHGVMNRNGATSQLNEDYSYFNPEYFRYLDSLVDVINDYDMVAVLVPLWAGFSDIYDNGITYQFDHDESMLLARYVGARYGGDNVAWIVGGDNIYDTPELKSFFGEFARNLKSASGGRHLATIHPHGWGSSFDYFDNTTDWLDFHMYQSSHTTGGDHTWGAAYHGYGMQPSKPIVNGEPNYEDIFYNLWLPGDTVHPHTFRVEANFVRQAVYESVLSGSTVGVTYGANGVWQWHTPDQPGTHDPRFYVDSAWKFLGSGQMTIMRGIMEEVEWYRTVPRKERVVRKQTLEDEFVSVAERDSLLISYIPIHTTSVTYDLSRMPKGLQGSFVSVVDTNVRIPIDVSSIDSIGTLTNYPPDTADWVVLFSVKESHSPTASVLAHAVRPNPFFSSSRLDIFVPDDAVADLEIFDAMGRLVRKARKNLSDADEFPLENMPSGIFFYRVHLAFENGVESLVSGRFVSLGQ